MSTGNGRARETNALRLWLRMLSCTNLIEQQIRKWELARKQVKEAVRPCVAMSRLPGTPGAEIGQAVDLGMRYHRLPDHAGRPEGAASGP